MLLHPPWLPTPSSHLSNPQVDCRHNLMLMPQDNLSGSQEKSAADDGQASTEDMSAATKAQVLFMRLPNEIQLMILRYLGYQDLISLQKTNAYFNDLLKPSLIQYILGPVAIYDVKVSSCRHCGRYDPTFESLVWRTDRYPPERKPYQALCTDCVLKLGLLRPRSFWYQLPRDQHTILAVGKCGTKRLGLKRNMIRKPCIWCSRLHNQDQGSMCLDKFWEAVTFNQAAKVFRGVLIIVITPLALINFPDSIAVAAITAVSSNNTHPKIHYSIGWS